MKPIPILLSPMSHPYWVIFMELFPSNPKFWHQLIHTHLHKVRRTAKTSQSSALPIKKPDKKTLHVLSAKPVLTLINQFPRSLPCSQPGTSLPGRDFRVCWTRGDFSKGCQRTASAPRVSDTWHPLRPCTV